MVGECVKLEKFLLLDDISKVYDHVLKYFKKEPSVETIQGIIATLKKRLEYIKEKDLCRCIIDECYQYIKSKTSDSSDEFRKDVELIIKNWYTSCPRALSFVTEVINTYKKHYGKVDIDEK